MSVCELSDWLGTYSGVLNKEQFVREGVKFIRDIHGGAGISEENLKVSLSKMYAVPSRDPMTDPYISAIFSSPVLFLKETISPLGAFLCIVIFLFFFSNQVH
mgnify:CR=1 FL=1